MTRRLLLRRRHDDDGAVLVIWVVALAALLLFVGIAVDLGNLSQTVRLSQNSVDDAALLGAQEWASGSSLPTVVSDVEAQFLQNYPGVTWDWTFCSAVSGFSYSVDSHGQAQNCIGNATLPTGSLVVSVDLPSNNPLTTSGFSRKSGGPSSFTVHTSAQASAQSPGGVAILPVGITSAAGAGGLICIKGGNGNQSCPNNVSPGDEGMLDSPRYRTFIGTANDGNGNNDTTAVDLAAGLDHSLQVYSSGSGNSYYCDSDGSGSATVNKCHGAGLNNTPSTYDEASYAWLVSGNTANTVQNGLLDGFPSTSTSEPHATCNFVPRLQHPDGWIAGDTCSSVSSNNPASPTISNLDSAHLTLNGRHVSWYLLYGENGQSAPAAGAAVFATAYPGVSTLAPTTANVNSNTWTAADNKLLSDQMKANSALATPADWFSSSIAQSPRFAFVPVMDNCGGGSSSFCKITGFQAAYLDQILIQGHDVSVEAWIFNPKMIQNGPAPPGAGSGSYLGGPFVVNLCHESSSGGTLTGNC